MKRRDFVYGTAAFGGELLINSQAFGQATSIPPTRLTSLLDRGAQEGATCQCVLFTGQNLLCLYSAQATSGVRQHTISATTPKGDSLWNHRLPPGSYISLGTHGQSVLVCSLYSFVSGQRAVPHAVLLLDPITGGVTSIGSLEAPEGPSGGPYFAGDSLLFAISSGQGEVWGVKGGLEKELAGITARSLSNVPAVDLVAPGLIRLLAGDGSLVTTISIPGGGVEENPVSAEAVASRRTFYQSLFATRGIDPGKAKARVISAVGGDGKGNLYAVLSPFQQRVAQLVKIESSGAVSGILQVQLPKGASGAAVGPMRLIVLDTEIGIVSYNAGAAWYPLAAGS